MQKGHDDKWDRDVYSLLTTYFGEHLTEIGNL